jgi:hypothetical protein
VNSGHLSIFPPEGVCTYMFSCDTHACVRKLIYTCVCVAKKARQTWPKKDVAANMPRKSKNKKKKSPSNSEVTNEVVTKPKQNDPTIKKNKEKKELTEEERERREKQKELQKIILRLMKRGASKDEIRRAKIQYRHGGSKFATGKQRKRPRDRSGNVTGSDWRSEKFGEGRKNRQKEEEKGPEYKHDMVIVPVFWKKEVEQRQHVVEVAEKLKKDIIQLVQFDIWIDQRTKYTPGQKFAFWEHKGLKYRLELGPKEIENNQCTVCLCSTPGAVAQRYKVKLDANLIVQKLRELGAPMRVRGSAENDGMVLIRRSVKKRKVDE